jgi:hypothetical protein
MHDARQSYTKRQLKRSERRSYAQGDLEIWIIQSTNGCEARVKLNSNANNDHGPRTNIAEEDTQIEFVKPEKQ